MVLGIPAVRLTTADPRSDLRSESPTASPAAANSRLNVDSKSAESVRLAMNQVYAPVAQALTEVEAKIAAELQSPYEAVGDVLRHGTQLGGKRLRPALVLLAASASGTVCQDHIVLGTVIEMVHTATLVHDDVLDKAETRRHVATVNARWDDDTSILLGDYLFAQSYRLAATLETTSAARQIGEAARLVCEGELRQVLDREQFLLDEETYIGMIRGKTAELCRIACRLGAEYAGASEPDREALATYGDALGIAFQIADDYLDWWGDDDSIGKTLGTDVLQGKMTLPMIRLIDTVGGSERKSILAILDGPADQRLARLRPLLDRSDARAYTASLASHYRDLAVSAISGLTDSQAKCSLAWIADFSIHRTF